MTEVRDPVSLANSGINAGDEENLGEYETNNEY